VPFGAEKEMTTASSITRQAPVTETPRQYPTEWTLYAEDQTEKNETEQASRKTLRLSEEETPGIRGIIVNTLPLKDKSTGRESRIE
jgi:hypothetical protein